MSKFRFFENRLYSFVPRITSDQKCLIVEGKYLDQVFMISEAFPQIQREDWYKAGLDFASRAWSLSNQQYPAPTLHSVVMALCAHAYGENGKGNSYHGRQKSLASLVDDWIFGAFKIVASPVLLR